jgi:beta-ureidopropionase
MTRTLLYASVLFIAFLGECIVWAAPADPSKTPGRQVKVATIAIETGGDHDKKLKLAVAHLEVAGQKGVDIACLPEEFAGYAAEFIPGPTTQAIGELAKKHRMYVVCPIREKAQDGRQYNTAVLLDRQGCVAGTYRKAFVFWTEHGVSLGPADIPVFDADFGRVAMLICFDANFDEVWQAAARKGAEIVLWPSAYGGGLPLNGYAAIHNYYIVAVGRGNIIDPLGKTVESTQTTMPKQLIATLDLDLTIVHKDFTREKVDKLMFEQKGRVELLPTPGDMEGWFVLRAIAPGVSVRDLCKQYQIETLREYRQRSRNELNALRKADKPVP